MVLLHRMEMEMSKPEFPTAFQMRIFIFSLKMEPEMSLYNRPENSSDKNQSSQIGFA